MLLGQVPRRSGLERAHRPLIFRVRAEHEDLDARMPGAEIAQRLDEGGARHADVEENYVDRRRAEQLEQLRYRRRLAGHRNPDVLSDDPPQSFADDRMIVGDRQSNHWGLPE